MADDDTKEQRNKLKGLMKEVMKELKDEEKAEAEAAAKADEEKRRTESASSKGFLSSLLG